MKRLLDQNISHPIVASLHDVYPESAEVGQLEMGDATDKDIWGYAQQHDYAIVTLDADFHAYSLLWSGPPLIVSHKSGNQPKKLVLEKLLANRGAIEQTCKDPEICCIEIY